MSRPLKIRLAASGAEATLDAAKLVDTRMLITGNSGSGKSWLLRLIAEQAAPKMQTIIIDPEGEYATLREKVDAVLVGKNGEVMPTIATAPKLARKLLELGVSAIVDIYELKLSERRTFVRAFLDSMMSAPKKLWRPCLVILDESHRFCPERGSGQAESTDSVITLLSQGRKRGFCGILATQRISKLHKDAVAEAVNNLVGRTTLDVDVHRARDVLGLAKKDEALLRGLESGQWYGFGPAFQFSGVGKFRAAKVTTTHPRAGSRHKLTAPAPSAKIKRVLPELAELPKEVEQERNDLSSARARVRELEAEIRKLKRTKWPQREGVDAAVKRAVDKAVADRDKKHEAAMHRVRGLATRILDASAATKLVEALPEPTPWPAQSVEPSLPRHAKALPSSSTLGNGGMRRMLIALAQTTAGCKRVQLAILAGMSARSGTFSTYLGRLRSLGYMTDADGRMFATDSGIDALGDFQLLPTGHALVEHWGNFLGNGGLRRMYDALVEAGATGLTRGELARRADLSSGSGTFSTYLGKLRSLQLANGSDPIVIAETLR